MEHLPTPCKAIIPAIEVPYLCGTDYDGSGMNLPDPETHPFEAEHGVFSQLQNWLYFGFMHNLFGNPFSSQDFLHKISGSEERRVCTCKLDAYICRWQKHITAASKVEKMEIFGRTFRLIEEARRYCGWFDQPAIIAENLSYSAVMLSVKVMLSSTLIAASGLPPGESLLAGRKFYPMIPEMQYPLPSGSILWEHMLMTGWCVHDLKRLFVEYGYNTIYYLASLKRDLGRPRDHRKCHESAQCTANNMGSNFKPKHIDECSGSCPDISSPMDKVNAILSEGDIPIISHTDRSQQKPQIEVLKAGSNTNYTAITHVWADGLGNPSSNALPMCQVQRLTSQIRKANKIKSSAPCLLWLDVFCIPLDDTEANRKLKMAAINRMIPTYAGAKNVLMLDSQIQKVHFDPDCFPCAVELSAHILSCAWYGRCWTHQEACLARDTFIQCASPRAVSFLDLRYKLGGTMRLMARNEEAFSEHEAVLADLGDVWNRAVVGSLDTDEDKKRDPNAQSLTRDQQFAKAWNGLLGKTTTKWEDVLCIVANLLDFRASEILSLPQDQQMKSMLHGQDRLPTALLFSNGPRLDSADHRERWVPSRPGGLRLEEDSTHFMRVTPGGLEVDGRSNAHMVFIPCETHRFTKLCFIADGSEKFWVELLCPEDDTGPNTSRIGTLLLLDAHAFERNKEPPYSSGLLGRGAALAVLSHEENYTEAAYDSPLLFGVQTLMMGEDKDRNSWPTFPEEKLQDSHKVLVVCDIASWPKPSFRRPSGAGLKKGRTYNDWLKSFRDDYVPGQETTRGLSVSWRRILRF
ncbi:hypothetical protein AOQ84DRAFT_441058 [Glonium stellatum]|uniref:Heterokaryon incompatibility domain-containing protein n=1 Tax=Glonium stellatum TaxID=574774 RepID=A0A8E2JR56_9PEZI|nr:hypothetical protein AOQ84DRAFT_441058 [Glonium stellatum]